MGRAAQRAQPATGDRAAVRGMTMRVNDVVGKAEGCVTGVCVLEPRSLPLDLACAQETS